MFPKFLVVDDDPISNRLCQFGILRVTKDADVKMFTVPEDALEMIRTIYAFPAESTFTILFLDINMPSMTGWEFLDIFKGYDEYIRQQFKIYILSSSVDERDIERAQESNLITDFLSKPIKAEHIRDILLRHEAVVPG